MTGRFDLIGVGRRRVVKQPLMFCSELRMPVARVAQLTCTVGASAKAAVLQGVACPPRVPRGNVHTSGCTVSRRDDVWWERIILYLLGTRSEVVQRR